MKNNFLFLIIMLSLQSDLSAVWKIGLLSNQSDLDLQAAYYLKPKKKKIGRLSSLFASKSKSISMNYTVSETSNGCSLIILSNGYLLSLDYQFSHALKWKRVKTKPCKSQSGKDLCDVYKDSYCARVFLEKGDDVVQCAAQGYSSEDKTFDIVLSGSNGTYAIFLKPA